MAGSSDSRSPKRRQACAACRHQRKKCNENCITAPYFPAERADEFQSVLKVFGVKKITKLLELLSLEDRQEAADSFKWEASMRHQFPILGPLMQVRELETELQLLKNKLKQLEEGRNNLRSAPNQLSNGMSMIQRNYDGNINNFVPNNINNNYQNITPMYIPSGIDGVAQAQRIGLADHAAASQPNVYAEQGMIKRLSSIDHHHHNYSERGAPIGSQNISYGTYNYNGKLVQQQRNIGQMISDPAFVQRQQQQRFTPVGCFPTIVSGNRQSQYAPIVMNNRLAQGTDLTNCDQNSSGGAIINNNCNQMRDKNNGRFNLEGL